MKSLILIACVVLAQQPAKVPESGGINEESSKVGEKIASGKHQTRDSADSPCPPQTMVNIKQSPTPSPRSNESPSNEDEEIQREVRTFTGLLVVVGFLQAGILLMQWWIFKRQTDHFGNVDRAWIQVVVQKIQGLKPSYNDFDNVWIWPDIMNRGKTPARIMKMVMRAHRMPKDPTVPAPAPPRLPAKPEYPPDQTVTVEVNNLQFPDTGITPFPVNVWGTSFAKVEAREEFLYVYGYVDYLDVGGSHRITRFCELYWVPYGTDDPHPKGFVTSIVIPRAYTEST